jgi:hypothetical protein
MITKRSRKGIAARTIQINSFRFYLMATDNIDDRALAVKYLANQTGTWLRRNGEVLVPAPSLSALDAMEGIQHWRKP